MFHIAPFERVFLLPLVLLLISCQTTPTLNEVRRVRSSEEVANVFVSAYPAVPWSAIASKLEPKNNLSIADARALAAVSTQSQVMQFMSTFAAGLALGLPSKSSTSTTSTQTDGTSVTIASRKLEPGAVPVSAGATLPPLTNSQLLPDFAKSVPAVPIDGTTSLMNGVGLYQLAQILDNQISNAITPQGYTAYLTTFQVNLQPLARNLPYDAYVNLTMMPASLRKAVGTSGSLSSSTDELAPIIVYPLIISDAMESSTVGRSIDVIRQAALSLSGIVNNIGLNTGFSGASDHLDTLLGLDRNSLVTVGRISDHSLRIRLGAQQQGSRQLALVPHTQNISVVIFTKDDDNTEKQIDKLSVITEVSFADAATGYILPSERNTPEGIARLNDQVIGVLKVYQFEFRNECRREGMAPVDLLRAMDRSDYIGIVQCLQKSDLQAMNSNVTSRIKSYFSKPVGDDKNFSPGNTSENTAEEKSNSKKSIAELLGKNEITVSDEVEFKRMVAELMTLQSNSRFSKFLVQLGKYKKNNVVLPDHEQLLIINDDGDSLKVTLRGGANLGQNSIKARMYIPWQDGYVPVIPTLLSVDNGADVNLEFPSLAGNKLTQASGGHTGSGGNQKQAPVNFELTYVDAPTDKGDGKVVKYLNSVIVSKERQKSIKSPVSISSTALVADSGGFAQVELTVGQWDAKKSGDLAVQVTGAEIAGTVPAIQIDAKRRALPLIASSSVTLKLANVTPGQLVHIQTIANSDAVGSTITLPVTAQGSNVK
jgi:hypothetical protein